MAEIDPGVMQYLSSREPTGDTPADIQQLTPVDRQGLSQQYFQKDAPEWARVAAQILPYIMPGLGRGAGMLQAAQDPGAQPQTGLGNLLTYLPGLGRMALSRVPWGKLGGRMQPLPESAARGPEGQLKKLYHGTVGDFPDFDMAHSGSGGGGDLYGPGIYMTEDPQVAGGYAKTGKRTVYRAEALQKIYTPGSIHGSYGGGYDKVLQFDPGDGQAGNWNWQVQVQEVDAKGNALPGTRPRWHSTPPEVANQPTIRPVYANIKNPFDIEATTPWKDAVGMLQHAGLDEDTLAGLGSGESPQSHAMPNKYLYRLLTKAAESKEYANYLLQQAGYDGITHIGGSVTGGKPHQVHIAFSPDQVYPTFGIDAAMQLQQQPRYTPGLSEMLPKLQSIKPSQGE